MFDRDRLIDKLFEGSYPTKDIVKKELDYAYRIANARLKYEQSIATLEKKFREEKMKLKEKLNKDISLCKHTIRTRHPDPSGNNDSYTSCDICGKEL